MDSDKQDHHFKANEKLTKIKLDTISKGIAISWLKAIISR